jgi:hypothetical protein
LYQQVNQNIKRFQLVVQSPQLELLQELRLPLGPLLALPQLELLRLLLLELLLLQALLQPLLPSLFLLLL